MSSFCVLSSVAILALTVGLIAAAIRLGRKHHERWGTVLAVVETGGEGAYRHGVLSARRLRGVPWIVWLAGIGSGFLAPFTGLICAPLGLLGGAFMLNNPPSTALGVLTLFVALDGLVLPFGLWRAGAALMRCEGGSGESAIRVGLWSLLHHVAIGGGWAIVMLDEGAALAVAPACFGALHALALIGAGRVTGDIQRSMPEEERAELRAPSREPLSV